MKLLRQLGIISAIYYLGEIVHACLGIPIPGSVIGMLILFLCLLIGVVKLEMLEEVSKFLIDHLAFFFVPAGVGLIAYMSVIQMNWAPILGISFVTTILVMVITGHTVQILKRGNKE